MKSWLSLEGIKQCLDALKPFLAFDREVQGLRFKARMAGIEESDHRSRRAEVAPCRLDNVALPAGLVRSLKGATASLPKLHAAWTRRFGFGAVCLRTAHVTNPGRAGVAPSASRMLPICSAYSRANWP